MSKMAKECDLSGMSADQIDVIVRRATSLSKDLRSKEPTYELALLNGIDNRSYRTVRWGLVPSYSGTAIIQMDNGMTWKAIGHKPRGTAEYIEKDGYIEFILLSDMLDQVRSIIEAEGYDLSASSDGERLILAVSAGEASPEDSDDYPDADAELHRIRGIIAPLGAIAEWTGDGNSDADGYDTFDIAITIPTRHC